MKVALVHDYLNQRGGAERVFARIAQAWPDAPIYTALYDEQRVGDISRAPRPQLIFRPACRLRTAIFARSRRSIHARSRPSIFAASMHRQLDDRLGEGRRFPPDAVHVCYINTVSRFAFAYDEYVRAPRAPADRSRLIAWDREAAKRPTRFVANSQNVARTHRANSTAAKATCCIARSTSIVSTSAAAAATTSSPPSRLLPYKRIDLAIRAAALAGVKLVRRRHRAGGERRCASSPTATTTTMLGYVPDAQLNALLGDARAVIVPGEEDFGLVPLEAAAAGRPTIAFRGGGALETIVEGETGAFFDEPTPESLAGVLRDFDPSRFDPRRLRAHAEKFAPAQFIERLAGDRRASISREARMTDDETGIHCRRAYSRSCTSAGFEQAVCAAVRRRSRNVSADARESAPRLVVELRRVAAAFCRCTIRGCLPRSFRSSRSFPARRR